MSDAPGFWAGAAAGIDWARRPDQILDGSATIEDPTVIDALRPLLRETS